MNLLLQRPGGGPGHQIPKREQYTGMPSLRLKRRLGKPAVRDGGFKASHCAALSAAGFGI
jgi:hypothetical protein